MKAGHSYFICRTGTNENGTVKGAWSSQPRNPWAKAGMLCFMEVQQPGGRCPAHGLSYGQWRSYRVRGGVLDHQIPRFSKILFRDAPKCFETLHLWPGWTQQLLGYWFTSLLSDHFFSPSFESTSSSVYSLNMTFLSGLAPSLFSQVPFLVCCIHFNRFKHKVDAEFFQIFVSGLSLISSRSRCSSPSWYFTGTSNQIQKNPERSLSLS